MTLKDLNLKPFYDSRQDDIINMFYVPALSSSKQYLRLSGFFSSTSLALASKGISRLIQNNGEMKIVTSPKLSKVDVDAIIDGHKKMEEVVESNMIKELEIFENEIIRDHVRALAWMVANKKLEIKLAIVESSDRIPLDYQTATIKGIFHQKVGIFKDKEKNMISFSGSINETATGWMENVEEFKVFRGWERGEIPYLLADMEKFKKYWFGNDNTVKMVTVPKAVEEKLIEICPPDILKLKLIENVSDKERARQVRPRIELRNYQQSAIDKWFTADCRGIMEMATSTGKTFVAIECLNKLMSRNKRLLTVIIVPTLHLINQWKGDIDLYTDSDAIEVSGSYSSWSRKLSEKIDNFNLGYSSNTIVITTYDTFSSQNFIDTINKTESKDTLIVADEVHSVGSPERRNGLIGAYNYRLGLSATPERWFDDFGTKVIIDYFKQTVFRYTMRDAINDGILSSYNYHPILIELNDDEFQRYIKISKKMARLFHSIKDKEKQIEILSRFAIMRGKIIQDASKKIDEFEKLVSDLSKRKAIKYCLIYCSSTSPKQMDNVQKILNEHDILQCKFTAHESLEERKDIIKLFKEGKYKALVSMKCLDEGVNVPAINTAIILSSTSNPRQFIQRRGRILRKTLGKTAIIYDFIVIPTLHPDKNSEYFDLEANIIRKELLRYIEFASSALNSGECYKKLENIRRVYNI